jgi:hypothetical protein
MAAVVEGILLTHGCRVGMIDAERPARGPEGGAIGKRGQVSSAGMVLRRRRRRAERRVSRQIPRALRSFPWLAGPLRAPPTWALTAVCQLGHERRCRDVSRRSAPSRTPRGHARRGLRARATRGKCGPTDGMDDESAFPASGRKGGAGSRSASPPAPSGWTTSATSSYGGSAGCGRASQGRGCGRRSKRGGGVWRAGGRRCERNPSVDNPRAPW